MIEARVKQHYFSTYYTELITPMDDSYAKLKETMLSKKLYEYEETRNGHIIDKVTMMADGMIHRKYEPDYMYQYELFFKPEAEHEFWIGKFNEWLNNEEPGSKYIWNNNKKRNDGNKPKKYGCWCGAIEEFLVLNDFEWVGWENDGAGTSGTQIRVKK